MAAQYTLYFTGLDTETAYLDLVIHAAQELDAAIRMVTSAIPGLIHLGAVIRKMVRQPIGRRSPADSASPIR